MINKKDKLTNKDQQIFRQYLDLMAEQNESFGNLIAGALKKANSKIRSTVQQSNKQLFEIADKRNIDNIQSVKDKIELL